MAFPLAANNRSTTPTRTPASSSAIRSTSSITEQQPLQRSKRPRQPAPSTIRKPITTRKPRPPPRARWSSHSLFQAVPPTTHALRSAPGRPARCKLALTPSTRIVANPTPVSRPGSTQWTQLNQTWSTSTIRTSSTRCSPKTTLVVTVAAAKVEPIRAALWLVASITWPNPTEPTSKRLMWLSICVRARTRRWPTPAKSCPRCKHLEALITATHYSSSSCSKGQP